MFKCNCDFFKKINFKKIKDIKSINKNTILVIVAIIAVIITGVLIFSKSYKGFSLPNIFGVSANELGKKAVDYINDNQLSQTPASLVSASEVSGLIKVKIKIGEQEFDSYVSKDGKLLFPQAFEMTPVKTENIDENEDPVSLQKTDSPMLEAFVVAACPYGLQMQRAAADAVANISSLASNVIIRYIGSISNGKVVAMHDQTPGGEEAQENLRQICIREEQSDKYWNYISCYMKKSAGTLPNGMPLGDTTGCLTSTGVNTIKLNTCMTDSNKGLTYAKVDFDLSDKYNVSGSPTLILNGTTISESGYGGRSSDGVKSMVCAGFNSEASFCSTELNKTGAAVSFSPTYLAVSGSANQDASCQ